MSSTKSTKIPPTALWPIGDFGCEDCAYLTPRHDDQGKNPCLACDTVYRQTGERPYWAPVKPVQVGKTWPIFIPLSVNEQDYKL